MFEQRVDLELIVSSVVVERVRVRAENVERAVREERCARVVGAGTLPQLSPRTFAEISPAVLFDRIFITNLT